MSTDHAFDSCYCLYIAVYASPNPVFLFTSN